LYKIARWQLDRGNGFINTRYQTVKVVTISAPVETVNLAYLTKEIRAELSEKQIIHRSDPKCDQNGAVRIHMQTAIITKINASVYARIFDECKEHCSNSRNAEYRANSD
jgi:hypothetical protein